MNNLPADSPSDDAKPIPSENVPDDQAPTVLAHAPIPSEPQGETIAMNDSVPPVPDGSIPPAPFEPMSESVPPTPEPPLTPEIIDANPPKKSNRTIWIVVILIVLLLCCCCAIVASIFALPALTSGGFMNLTGLNAFV